jgi:5'-nucleotidase / UDP-sugar diphosphatase
MFSRLKLGLFSASLIALSSGSAFADFELDILHINDFHSRIESINKYDSTCSAEDETAGKCFGGAARLLTAINQTRDTLKGEGKNVILLNAGDNFQGSLFFTTYHGAAEAEFLNLMKFDAMTVGNHEFDESEDSLKTFLDKVQFPVVTANVKANANSTIKDRIVPSLVLTVGGEKVGIVGAVTNDTPELSSPGPNIDITVDKDAITAEVEKLKAEGVNKIIALTHVGYPRDLAVIAKIPDVDVVVGGHSHTLLSNTDEKAEGPYPTWVDNPGGYKVPVVQAASYSKYLGNLDVVFDDNGVVKSAQGDPILIDASFKPDEAVLARIKELAAPIEELRQKVIGSSTAPIEGSSKVCRVRECAMGDLVADAMVDRVKDQGMTIAIQNGGGLRASIDGGDVTMGEVLTVLPFQNTLATMQLKGADVVTALENGLSQIEDGAGRFPQVSGMKYSFDRSKPAGSRVVSVEVKEGDAYVPLDPEKLYGVTTNNYMRSGGDGYKIFATAAQNAYDYGPGLETVVADYVAAHSPYQPIDSTDRITDVTPADYVAPTAAPATATAAEVVKDQKKATEAAPAKTEMPAKTEAAAPAETPAKTEAPVKAETATPTESPAKPEVTTTSEMPAKTDMSMSYVVKKGDSLWTIAKEQLGDGGKWPAIAKENKLRHPNVISIGKELMLPKM